MTTRSQRIFGGGLLAAGILWACGPYFGVSLLQSRKEATLAAPAVSFYRALETLVPAPLPGLKPVDFYYWGSGTQQEEEKEKALAPRLVQIRSLTDGAKAWQAGDGLPDAVRLYTAGAVAFHARQLDYAAQQFTAVTALPEPARASRALWAEFMLGRVAALRDDRASAIKHFTGVRESVANRQTPDPLGLALASFGEEARMYWLARELKPAVTLYAQQAAYGFYSGRASLITVAGETLKDDALLDQAVREPLVRKLLLLYISARGEGVAPVTRLASALERANITDVTGLGLLAAASYSAGEFALAGRLAAREPDGAAAAWVRAKLALREGNTDAARTEYAKALAAVRKQPATEDVDAARLAAEAGLQMTNRGEYTQALDLFLDAVNPADNYVGSSDYWTDAAYLAERVLTLDELQRFVDRRVPKPVKFEKKADEEWTTGPAPLRLRMLLARRLMRAGRYDDAARYFDDAKVREVAADYAAALQRAQSAWRLQVWRAEAWLLAARLANKQGMEIIGYELAPDYAVYAGNYYGPLDEDLRKDAPAAESKLAKASASPRLARFHYYLTAVDHAQQAAALVPARSAAFGAILCEAASWTIDWHPKTAKALYARYVREGAFMPSLAQFARSCPEPRLESTTWWRARHALRPVSRRVGFDVTLPAAVALLGGVAALVVGVFRRKRIRPAM